MSIKMEPNIRNVSSFTEENKNTHGTEADADYITKCIGPFGVWQAIAFPIAISVRLIVTWNVFAMIYITPSTEFNCIQFKDNSSVKVQNSTCYEECNEYEFFPGVLKSTLTSDFELICQKEWLAKFTQSVLMFGVMLGVLLFGWISDRFGRRTSLLLSVYANVVLMFGAPFSPNYWTFTVLRFFIGLSSGGMVVTAVVFALEIVGSQYREVAGACAVIPDSLGKLFMVAFIYFSSTWKVYLIISCCVSAVISIFMIFLLESPRWLISQGRPNCAIKVLTKVAIRNRRSTTEIKDIVEKVVHDLDEQRKSGRKASCCDLFIQKDICKITISSVFIWIIVGTLYYGTCQYVSILVPDEFWSIGVMGCLQLPMKLVALVLNKTIGRKLGLISTLSVVGTTMMILTFTTKEDLTSLILGVVCNSASSASLDIIYLYTSELFPTSIRSVACGICSSGAKFGAMIAPFVAASSSEWIPTVTFALISFVAIAFSLILPETKGKHLKD